MFASHLYAEAEQEKTPNFSNQRRTYKHGLKPWFRKEKKVVCSMVGSPSKVKKYQVTALDRTTTVPTAVFRSCCSKESCTLESYLPPIQEMPFPVPDLEGLAEIRSIYIAGQEVCTHTTAVPAQPPA